MWWHDSVECVARKCVVDVHISELRQSWCVDHVVDVDDLQKEHRKVKVLQGGRTAAEWRKQPPPAAHTTRACGRAVCD